MPRKVWGDENDWGGGVRVQSRLAGPALSLALFLLLLGGLEGLCRAMGWGTQPVAGYIANWERQWDGDFYVMKGPRANRDGLRDRDHDIAPSAGVRRIVFLGDSVTFGFKVPSEHSFPAVVEGLLRDRGESVEVFNVALPGWSTRQQRIAYDRIVRVYQPDVVILGFCLNDPAEMQNNLARPPRALALAYEHSYLVRAVMRPRSWEIQRVEDLFEQPDSSRVGTAWTRTLDEVSLLARQVRDDDAQFGLVALPFRFQVSQGAPKPLAQDVLAEFSREEGIAYLDALPALFPLAQAGFVDYDHLSPSGAQAVAEAIVASSLLGR